jgi:hypothetical protein
MWSDDVACSVSAYHYNIVCSLVFLSILAHLAGIIGIRGYTTKQPRWVGYLRAILILLQFLLAVRLLLGRITSNFPTGAPDVTFHSSNNLTRLVLPVACFQSPNSTIQAEENALTSSERDGVNGGTLLGLLFIFYAAMLALAEVAWFSYLKQQNSNGGDDAESGPSEGDRPAKGSLRYVLGWVRGAVLLAASIAAGYVTYQMFKLRTWMDDSHWLGEHNEENDWTFGQILPMLILLFAFLAIVDSFPDFCKKDSDKSD